MPPVHFYPKAFVLLHCLFHSLECSSRSSHAQPLLVIQASVYTSTSQKGLPWSILKNLCTVFPSYQLNISSASHFIYSIHHCILDPQMMPGTCLFVDHLLITWTQAWTWRVFSLGQLLLCFCSALLSFVLTHPLLHLKRVLRGNGAISFKPTLHKPIVLQSLVLFRHWSIQYFRLS